MQVRDLETTERPTDDGSARREAWIRWATAVLEEE